MYIKNFLILSVVFLLACGGGSSATATTPTPSAAGGTNTGNITDQLQIVE